MRELRPALNYFGGKWMLANWIISFFPEHKIYVEPFSGGASVLIRKEVSHREIYNDIDDEIVNFFRVLRLNGNELKRQLQLTPYSRTEYDKARESTSNPIEMARRTVIKSLMGIGDSIHNKTGFRNSKTSTTPPPTTFRNYTNTLHNLTARLENVMFENLNYKECFEKYDTPDTLFYCDPPYPHNTRSTKHSYGHEMSDQDHYDFIEIIQNLKGKVILSSYENDIYDKLNWKKEFKTASSESSNRIEVLYIKGYV